MPLNMLPVNDKKKISDTILFFLFVCLFVFAVVFAVVFAFESSTLTAQLIMSQQ